MDSEKRKI